MPELAEVEFFRKQWDPGIGDAVQRVRTHPHARIFRQTHAQALHALKGQTLLSSAAHGKQLLFTFSGDLFLGIHLGMSGKLLSAVPEFVPDKHDHLVLVMSRSALVFSDYRMFGKVRLAKGQTLTKGQTLPEWWTHLPPQPQDPAFDLAHFQNILQRSPNRPLKALLLDQKYFPGIGNWMADEILWRARLHPASIGKCLSLPDHRRLFHSIKEVCRDALEVIGTSWGKPPDSWLFNHRWKKGGVCPYSGKPLVHETIGGRTTCFCPAIQREKR